MNQRNHIRVARRAALTAGLVMLIAVLPTVASGQDEDVEPDILHSVRVHLRTQAGTDQNPVKITIFDDRSPRIPLAGPLSVETAKEWKAVTESGIKFAMPYLGGDAETGRLHETNTCNLRLRIESDPDKPWKGTALAVGQAQDLVEWVLVTSPVSPENPTSKFSAADYAALRDGADATDFYFIIKGEVPETVRPNTATLQIRHQWRTSSDSADSIDSAEEDEENDRPGVPGSPAIIASYVITQPWQWSVLAQEGLIVHFMPGDLEDRSSRTVYEETAHEYELVAYAGSPVQPASTDLGALQLEVTGLRYTERKQEFVDLNVRKVQLTSESSRGETESEPLYQNFSDAVGLVWKFQEFDPKESNRGS